MRTLRLMVPPRSLALHSGQISPSNRCTWRLVSDARPGLDGTSVHHLVSRRAPKEDDTAFILRSSSRETIKRNSVRRIQLHLLIVEDDIQLADVVRRGLARDGQTADVCANGDDAVLQVELNEYDGIILDVMLPDLNGLEVLRHLRAGGITTPILMLTARDSVEDVVAGLEAGADDYLTKPFAFRELRARLQSIMRRASGSASSQLQAGDIVVDVSTQEVLRAGLRVPMTNREYQVLEYLMHNRGRVLSRSMIEEHVWGYDYEGISNTVDVHIRRLRRKLDRLGESSIIETVRNAGYRLLKDPPGKPA
jgi:DNA-binding response OmpR family regulator